MKKVVEHTFIQKRQEIVCDICNKDVAYCSKPCYLCNKDVCQACSISIDTEKDYYEEIWYWECLCKECADPIKYDNKSIEVVSAEVDKLEDLKYDLISSRWKKIKDIKKNGSSNIQSIGSAP